MTEPVAATAAIAVRPPTSMPPIQATPPKVKKSFLASATRGVYASPHRIFLYGIPGIGKTTWAAGAPKPYFLDLQRGSARLDVTRALGIDAWDDVKAAMIELTTDPHDFETLVVDTVDDLELMIWATVCKRSNITNITDLDYGKGYDLAMSEWRMFLSLIERLQRARGMRVIVIGHSKVSTFKNPSGENYDRFSPAINDKAAALIIKLFDTVLFARQEVATVIDKKTKRARGVSSDLHVILTRTDAAYDAKNRDNLPERLSLDWDVFAEAVANQAPASAEDILAELAGLIEHVEESKQSKVRAAIAECNGVPARLARVLNRVRATVKVVAESESAS